VPISLDQPQRNPLADTPAGLVHMAMGDWGRVVQAVLRAERGQPTPVLRAETARRLTTPVVDAGAGARYALGWHVVDRAWAGGRTLVHGGTNGANVSVAWVAPERDVAFLAATNVGGERAALALDAVVTRLLVLHATGR
jgi:hypothetical protein